MHAAVGEGCWPSRCPGREQGTGPRQQHFFEKIPLQIFAEDPARGLACPSFLPPPFSSLPLQSRNHSTTDLCTVAGSCGPGRLPSRATTKCLWHLAKQSLPSFTRMQTPRGRKVSSLRICRWHVLAAWPGYRTISHPSLWGHPCCFFV